MMPKNKKKSKPSATNFSAMQAYFQPKVAALYAIDHASSALAFNNLARLILKYGHRVAKCEAVPDLVIYLYGRDRAAKAHEKNVYELSLELAMPGKFPPLSLSMRKTLALRLAYADKVGVEVKALPNFLAKAVPVKIMKDVLAGSQAPQPHDGVDGAGRSARPTRQVKRKRVPHRLAGSASHQAIKAGARARRKVIVVSE